MDNQRSGHDNNKLLTPRSSPSPRPHDRRASEALAKSVLKRCNLINHEYMHMKQEATYDTRTVFSAAINSCNGFSSWLPARAGRVEL